jgi:cell wall-associated NlpC family hydrolase
MYRFVNRELHGIIKLETELGEIFIMVELIKKFKIMVVLLMFVCVFVISFILAIPVFAAQTSSIKITYPSNNSQISIKNGTALKWNYIPGSDSKKEYITIIIKNIQKDTYAYIDVTGKSSVILGKTYFDFSKSYEAVLFVTNKPYKKLDEKTDTVIAADFIAFKTAPNITPKPIVIKPTPTAKPTVKPTPKPGSKEITGNDIVYFAKKFLGTPYLYGGQSPSTGFDCSGYVCYVYKNYKIVLPRIAKDQAKAGIYVKRENIKQGDLLFFDDGKNKGVITHVSIYIGNNQIIHATYPGGVIEIWDIDDEVAAKYVTARRVLK